MICVKRICRRDLGGRGGIVFSPGRVLFK